MKEWHIVKAAAVIAGGWAALFFGELNGLFYALVMFVAIDYITGVIKGVTLKKLSSETGYKGILKKILIFVVVGLGNIIDTHILMGSDYSIVRSMVIMFYLSNEGISIVENMAEIGVPIPEKLRDILHQLKDKNKK